MLVTSHAIHTCKDKTNKLCVIEYNDTTGGGDVLNYCLIGCRKAVVGNERFKTPPAGETIACIDQIDLYFLSD